VLPLRLERPIVILDVETTSAEPANARIVEIALERWSPGGGMVSYTSLVNPGIPIPAEATAVHGITDAMVADSPTWQKIGPGILRAFKGEDGVLADIAGYNVRFDCAVIAAENKRCGIDDAGEGAKVLDGFRLWQFLEPRTLSDAVRRWTGGDHSGAHRAMDDVIATREVLFAQLSGDARLRDKSVAEIDALLNPPDPNAATSDGKLRYIPGGLALNFGDHRGKPLREVDAGFLRWMLKKDFARDTKGHIESELRNRR
jgi:DNA polymerase-3 subunit epsilon